MWDLRLKNIKRNMKNVSVEQIERFKKNIDEFKNLKTYFGEDWLYSQLQIEEKDKKHPIFRILTDQRACLKLSEDLSVLSSNCNKFKSIINKLKSDKDKCNFHSLITEIDVISYYYRKYDAENVEYEPEVNVKGKNKKLDLKLIINGDEYYFEILTVFKEEIQRKDEKMLDEIKNRLKNLNLPFDIVIRINEELKENDIDELSEFVEKLLKKELIKDEKVFEFPENGRKLVKISFHKNNNGGNVGLVGPPNWLKPSDRAKNRILGKLENQLPENKQNIVVINLSHLEPFFHIPKINHPFLKDISPQIFTHEKGKFISMIIAYTNNDYKNNRRFYVNPSAQKGINENIIEKL